MRAKLIALVVFATVLAAALLGLRQQRLEIMHDMANMYARMNHARQDTWNTQVRIAQRLDPDALREALAQSHLELESITPADPAAGGWPTAVADAR